MSWNFWGKSLALTVRSSLQNLWLNVLRGGEARRGTAESVCGSGREYVFWECVRVCVGMGGGVLLLFLSSLIISYLSYLIHFQVLFLGVSGVWARLIRQVC